MNQPGTFHYYRGGKIYPDSLGEDDLRKQLCSPWGRLKIETTNCYIVYQSVNENLFMERIA